MEGRLEGHPVVAITFDPSISGLEKSLAFPLLISNATSFLLNEADTPVSSASAETFDPTESDIAPRPLPTFETISQPGGVAFGLDQQWLWFAAAALAVLGVEWLVFGRRG
jgi:hypothetical protein